MTRSVATFLMFQDGAAEEAMNLYVSLFTGSEVARVERFGPGEQGAEGSIKRAAFKLAGHDLVAFDSPMKHGLFLYSGDLPVRRMRERGGTGAGIHATFGGRRRLDAARQLRVQQEVRLGERPFRSFVATQSALSLQ